MEKNRSRIQQLRQENKQLRAQLAKKMVVCITSVRDLLAKSKQQMRRMNLYNYIYIYIYILVKESRNLSLNKTIYIIEN